MPPRTPPGLALCPALYLALLLGGACTFRPDLSRFPPCADGGTCPEGAVCLHEEGRCLPRCDVDTDCTPPGDGGPPDAGEPLVLPAEPLAAGVEGAPYAHPFTAQGGTPPYRFRTRAPLPPGLALGEDGVLSGLLPPAQLLRFTVEVRDSALPPRVAEQAFSLEVLGRLVLAGPEQLADAWANTLYEEALMSHGGRPPYTYTLAADGGTPPPGLQLHPDGRLTGTASQTGQVRFAVEVRDSAVPPQVATRPLSLEVRLPATLLEITSRELPRGRAGMPFAYTLRAEGGSGPYTWTLWAGTFPQGITPNESSGLLSGTPVQPGATTFTIEVRSGTTTRKTFTLSVD